jgi:MerR family mercuric resistance operon transcriptional regulator
MESLTIGKLARLVGVNTETIRFYERRGLIPRPGTSKTGYRQYGEMDVTRLVFIRRCIRLGFSLDSIQQLLNAHRDKTKKRTVNLDYIAKQIHSRMLDLEHLLDVISDMQGNPANEHDSQCVLEKLMRYERWRQGPELEDASY